MTTNVDFPNIPPQGVRFRLKARESKHVIFSRESPEPTVGHYLGAEYSDQIFTLLYGRGARKGLYAIKSWAVGKMLYSRTTEEPYVGHIGGDGDYDDNWFQFAQDNYDKDSFRIYCPKSNTVIFSRTIQEPTFGNFQGNKFNDQLWRFVIVEDD